MAALKSDSKPAERRRVSPKFYAHLKKLNAARRRTAEIIERHTKNGEMAEAALAVAWELLFDYFAKNAADGLDLAELNTLAGVIQKLSSGEGRAGISKNRESDKGAAGGLGEEGIREIESMLKLL